MAGLVGRLADAVDRRRGEGVDTAAIDALLAVAWADHLDADSAEATSLDRRIRAMAEMFGMDDISTQLWFAAAAPDIDATVAALYGALRGIDGPTRLGVGLAQELVGLPTMSGEGIERLGPAGALRRHGLIEVVDRATWLSSDVLVPHRVVAHALGVDAPERALASLIVHPIPVELPGTDAIARAIGAGAPLVWIRSALGSAGMEMAVGALRALDVAGVCVDLRHAPSGPLFHDLLRGAVREAGLLGRALVLGGAERLGSEGADALSALSDAVVPVLAISLVEWDSSWAARYPLSFDAPALEPGQRDALWRRAAPGDEGSDGEPGARTAPEAAADEGLAGLRLAPGAIVQTAQYAQWLASARGEPLSSDIVRASARRVSGTAALIKAVGDRRHGFDDLVLPDPVRDTLRQLVTWAQHRDAMLARGTLLQSRGKGSGLSALFTGSPGTGKTLAAHVIADELGIDLVQVDLSAIVDKYIGETEKNLERVFHQAESLNVVLFFDEADALFGRRSEVKDSHDRHANQEVAYLLQRMESYDGITILATNLRGNLDPAFSRRMSFIVHFPDPDEPTRRRIWEAHISRMGELDARDPIDLDHLAAVIELAGGDVRNIVVAAAYDAVAADELPGMRHLVRAARAEYRKLGRRIPAGEFAPRAASPSGAPPAPRKGRVT